MALEFDTSDEPVPPAPSAQTVAISNVRTETVSCTAIATTARDRARAADALWVKRMGLFGRLAGKSMTSTSVTDGVLSHMINIVAIRRGPEDVEIVYWDPWGQKRGTFLQEGKNACGIKARPTDDGRYWVVTADEMALVFDAAYVSEAEGQDAEPRSPRVAAALGQSGVTFDRIERRDGVHAIVEGMGPSFRIRIGEGKVGASALPSGVIWSVAGAVGGYVLQTIANPLPPGVPAEVSDRDILVNHFRYESGFQSERLRQTMVGTPGVFRHPLGGPIVAWSMRRPDDRPPVSAGPTTQSTTAIGSFATYLNGDTVVLICINGLGPDWDEESLNVQALRTAMSILPRSPGAVHPKGPI